MVDIAFLLVLEIMPHSWVFSVSNSIFFRMLCDSYLASLHFCPMLIPKLGSSHTLNDVESEILLLVAVISLTTHLRYTIINAPLHILLSENFTPELTTSRSDISY